MKSYERLRVVIQGFGFMGRMHAQAWQRIPGASLVAVVDTFTDVAQGHLKTMGLSIPVYATLEEAVTRETANVVDTCLPTDLHGLAIRAAAQLGCAILCEKPLASSLADLDAMERTLADFPVPFMTAHCIRFWPEYRYLATEVRRAREGKGTMGALRSLNFIRQSGRPAGGAGGWISDPKRSHGAALDLHIHDTDFIQSVLGIPAEVRSRGLEDAGGMCHIFTDYGYPGVIVRAEGGWDYPAAWGFRMAWQAMFEGGVLDYDSRETQSLKRTMEGAAPEVIVMDKEGGSASGGNISDLGGYLGEIRYFSDCLLQGRAIEESTLDQAATSVRITLGEIESARTGRPQIF